VSASPDAQEGSPRGGGDRCFAADPTAAAAQCDRAVLVHREDLLGEIRGGDPWTDVDESAAAAGEFVAERPREAVQYRPGGDHAFAA
jgi:dienelactone hydrolase